MSMRDSKTVKIQFLELPLQYLKTSRVTDDDQISKSECLRPSTANETEVDSIATSFAQEWIHEALSTLWTKY